ncbi:MAG: hypothetical protein HXX13_02155 [Bacteroidetes bacterium]|nr:hypothetical protein [Bacteroidota bacterium]
MKRTIYSLLVTAILFMFVSIAIPTQAQEPPHPPTTGHGATGNQNPSGASAPIDGGLSILVALGLAYSSRKSLKVK